MAYKTFNDVDWVADSFSPTGLPVSTDEVVCPAGMSTNRTDTLGNANDLDLDLLMTHPGFSGSFGASGAPIMSAADLVVVQGGGPFYFRCTDNGAAGLTTDEVRIEAANSGVVVVLGTDAAALNGYFATIIANRGNVLLDGSIVFAGSPIVKVGSIDSILGDVNLTIASGAPTLAELEQAGGLTTLHNVITDLRISAGTCFKETAKATNVTIFGGRLVYNHTAKDADNTIIEVHAGGELDLMQNAETKTIDKVTAHPGSQVLYHSSMHTITDFVDLRTSRA